MHTILNRSYCFIDLVALKRAVCFFFFSIPFLTGDSPHNLLHRNRFFQKRLRMVAVPRQHSEHNHSLKIIVHHNFIKFAQMRELPVSLFLLSPTPCPIPPVPLVVSFTSMHFHCSLLFLLLLAASALRFCPKTPRHTHICASSWRQRCTKPALASKIKVKVAHAKGQIIRVMRQMSWNKHVTRQMSWNKRYVTRNKHVTRQMSWNKCVR